jgi:TolB protein
MMPDGRSLVFTVTERERSSIATVRFADKSISVLTPTLHNAASPKVSRDGSLVLFSGSVAGSSGIYTMAPTGEKLRRLTPETDDCRTPAWSPSGREIVYSRNGRLHVLSLDTHNDMKLSSKGDGAPHWIKD